MHVHLLSGRVALPRPLGSGWTQTSSVWENAVAIRNTFSSLLQSESDSVSHSEVNTFIWSSFGRSACVMINSNGPPDHPWKCCRTKREVAVLEGPWQGEWGMEMEGRRFRKCCFDELWRRREKRGAQSLCSPAATSKSSTRNRFHYPLTAGFKACYKVSPHSENSRMQM